MSAARAKLPELDHAACYRALQARDVRFDGRFFVGVLSTGIYCRPICSARTPKPEHCTFHRSAGSAHAAGFRPCLRCRPEIAPGLAGWRGTGPSVGRALALIAEGALDGAGNVDALANRLGMGERHLRRLFIQHVGASPVAVASARRVLFARQLIAETRLPLAEVAIASGFGSIRRFNAVMSRTFGRAAGALRRPTAPAPSGGSIELRLGFVPPFDWPNLLRFLAARAIPGVELVSDNAYSRTVSIGDAVGTIEVFRAREISNVLTARLHLPSVATLASAAARLRRVFDLDVDPEIVGLHLSADPLLAPLVAERPGLRVPGSWDPFELAVRAILGQQISVRAATSLAGRLTVQYGEPLPAAIRQPGLTHLFPRPQALAGVDLRGIGLPGARAAALSGLAAAILRDPSHLEPAGDLDMAVRRLAALPGIGAWTAHYIAMRALREPDAFPTGDLVLLRAVGGADGSRPSASALSARAESWRPWRAYAAMHLWASEAAVRTGRTIAA